MGYLTLEVAHCFASAQLVTLRFADSPSFRCRAGAIVSRDIDLSVWTVGHVYDDLWLLPALLLSLETIVDELDDTCH